MSRLHKSQVPAHLPKLDFDIPSWAGKCPAGTHLDVMKGDKLIEKLIIDEKKCYYFGRNSDTCDFVTEHASCSRTHAALLYHKHLKRMFIVDLGSMHGSFIRNLRLEANKPTPVPYDTVFHFGASTRSYILKGRGLLNNDQQVMNEIHQQDVTFSVITSTN